MNIDFGVFQEVWDEFLAFMDTVMQWLQFVFGVTDQWPPEEEYPNINA